MLLCWSEGNLNITQRIRGSNKHANVLPDRTTSRYASQTNFKRCRLTFDTGQHLRSVVLTINMNVKVFHWHRHKYRPPPYSFSLAQAQIQAAAI